MLQNETYSVINCEKKGNCQGRDIFIMFLLMEFYNKKNFGPLGQQGVGEERASD